MQGIRPAGKLELVTDWPEPVVGEHDVMIRVKAAGLNFPDVLIIQGKYQLQPELPFIPGNESSGEVVAVGAAVTRYKPGDKVISVGGTGAFCAHIAVNENTVFPMPRAELRAGRRHQCHLFYLVSCAQAAGQHPAGRNPACAGRRGRSGRHRRRTGQVDGRKVTAAASSDEKLALCKQLGADELINYSTTSLRMHQGAYRRQGVDVVYDPVGGDYAELAIRGMAGTVATR